MSKLGKSRKIGITVAVACCMLLAIIFSADIKNLFVLAADALSALISTEETTDTSNTIVMRTDDAYDVYETDGYYAFSVYAPSTATYTIGVTAENGSVRVNTGEAISVNGTEMSVSLTEGTNVLYIMGCSSPSIQWERETCDLEPINRVCALVAGDLDQNGERTLLELIRLKKEAAVEGTLTTDTLAREEIADIDRDNSVTDEDARLLRELLVGNPRYEASELRPVIVDAYLADTGILYDSLADAIAAASTISVSESKDVTVTVVNPTDVYITEKIVLDGGANILLTDDGATDNGWSRTITRASTLKEEMFAVAEATLTLDGSSDSDEHSSLILDGGAISASSNHFVDVGNANYNEDATLIMDKGVKLTNNVNTGQGGAIAVQTRFIMNGGIISGNLANGAGGAIVLLGSATKNEVTVPAATMTMSGGIITENESTKELYSSGGVSISGGATLNMTGGEIYNNITPVSLDNNSVRKSGTSSVFTMGGSAYVDRVCFDSTSVDTHCVELTSKLTTTKDITLFFTQPLNSANPVVKRDSSFSECDALFKLSEHMVPCQLVQDDSNENLCLRSDVTDMETVVVGEEPVYSSSSDSAFQALGISGSDWTVQGVCADDTYLYMAIAQSPSVGCRVLKVELGTWKYVDCSDEMLLTDHSNEMTYNPNTGRIYITHCISEGTGNTTDKTGPYAISIVDPANLNVLEDTIYLSDSSAYTGTTGISALAYNATQDYYVASGTGFRFGFLKGATGEDSTYSITETAMPSTGLAGFTGYTAYTKQGVYATDTTIYTNTWYDITNVTGEEQNFLTIYDWSGNYHGTQYIVNSDGSAFTREIESMFEYNGTMYMACFPKDYSVVAEVYALSDVGKAESTIDVIDDATGSAVDGVYTNLSDAITKANTLESATIVLHTDVTIGAKQTITGNVTIKDDGTARTIIRGAAYKGQMFVTDSSSASLTLQATGTDKDNPTLILDGNGVQKCNAMISLEKSSGTLSVTGPVKFTNAHINQNGGIIRTVSGEASITIDGAVFTDNTVVTATLNGGLINVLGTSKVTIKDTVFDNNVISSSGAVKGAILYVNGGTANVVDSAFTSNITTTTEAGGGLLRIDSGTLNIGKYTDEDGTTTVEGACTFTNNSFTASEEKKVYGGVISLGDDASAQVYNSTFTSNTAEFGNISLNNGATLTIGDSELSNNLTTSTTEPDSKDIRATGTSGKVIVEGKVKTTVYCNNSNKLQIGSQLEASSEITITGSTAVISEGKTLVSFTGDNVADVMADCKANGYLKVASEDYTLVYDTTDNTAKLASVVATIEEEKYASLADAIEAANALDSATIVLKADVTVDATQTITGNVTITDDGTARTITREEGFTNQMFLVADGAGLTFTATGEDKTSPTLTINGNGEVAGPSGAMVSLGTGSGTLTVTHAVRFTNANISEDGGIIRTGTAEEAVSTAKVTINGGVFDNNTAERTDAVSGGLIKVVGEAEVTISNALFQNNTIKSTGGALKGGIVYIGGGTVNVVGSTFTSTTAYTKNAGVGGVIAVYGGTLNVGKYVNGTNETIEEDCSFTNNSFTGASYGGAISISEASANVYVYNTTIQSNTAQAGGGIHVATAATLAVGDSTITDNTTTAGSARTNLNAAGTVKLEGKVNASLFCQTENQLHVKSKLSEGSEVKVAWLMTANGIVEGETFVTFENADVMADCKKKGYIILVDNDYVSSQDYALSYETTSDPQYIAKLTSAVATIGERGYASLADAIEAANALESATIVLKADVTVDATQTIKGNVTITDDGTARTITREEGFTDRMFEVADGAGLTFTATGTNNTSPTLTIDGNNVGPSGAMVSLGSGGGTLAVNNAVQFTKANINEDGGIIRTEDGSTAKVTIDGGVFAYNTVAATDDAYGLVDGDVSGDVYGGLINVAGSAEVTISNALFEYNEISSVAGLVKGGILYVEGGTLNVVGSTFTSNTAETYNAGGGLIRIDSGTLNIGKYTDEDGTTIVEGACTFTNNSFTASRASRVYGGVIALGDNASAQVYNSTFTSNIAECGNISLNGGATLTIGDSELSNNRTTSTTEPDSKDIRATGTSGKVIVEGKVKTTVYCNNSNKLQIGSRLEAGSEITITGRTAVITEGTTLVSFTGDNVADVMADCRANGYLKVASEDYTLVYDTTDNTAKLASVVATIGEEKYTSLADAIEAANEAGTTEAPATIVLKADATVDETQAITGNVTITDDGTAKTLTRGAECTAQVFDVQEGASLTLAGTGTTTEEGTVQGTITVDGNKGNVAATESMIVNAGTFNLGEHASLTNAGNESDTTTTGGALYNAGTATLAGTFSGNEAYMGGAVYTAVGATLNITGGTFGTEGKGNTSGYRAGAVYVQESTSAETIARVTISNATFSYNSSYRSGGSSAGALFVGKYADVTIDGCTFSNNSATAAQSSTSYGGSIYMDAATVEINNSSFSNNSAIRGGAVYMSQTTNELTLHNCDFADNAATAFGRDVFYDKLCNLILSGKIGNAQIDKREGTINVVGNLDPTSQIEIMQISGTIGLAQVQFDSAEATQIGAQCITYYDYYNSVNEGLTLQFDTETYQAIMK